MPPGEESGRRKEREADNPNELWDDPVGGVTGAASDFSSFGSMPDEGEPFDFEKMAEESKKLDSELRGTDASEASDDDYRLSHKVDPTRPLATVGTTIVSGSGEDVNVFEDFDTPSESESEAPAAIRAGDEDPSANASSSIRRSCSRRCSSSC